MKVEHWKQHYDISWAEESGWRVRVEIHDSTMYVNGLYKVFENCESPEHAFTQAHEWARATLATLEEDRKGDRSIPEQSPRKSKQRGAS